MCSDFTLNSKRKFLASQLKEKLEIKNYKDPKQSKDVELCVCVCALFININILTHAHILLTIWLLT